MTLAIIGNGSAAESLAALIGAGREVLRIPCPDGGSAEGRLEAIQSAKWTKVALAVAATGDDEHSLVAAAAARHAGAPRSAAVVGSFSLARREDLAAALGLERLIEPDAEVAAMVAALAGGPIEAALRTLRRGPIGVMELTIAAGSPAMGASLKDLRLPKGSRVAMIRREGSGGRLIAPSAATALSAGDRVVLVANRAVAADAAARLGGIAGHGRRALVVGGGGDAARAARLAQHLREYDVAADAVGPEAAGKGLQDVEVLVLLDPGALARIGGPVPAHVRVFVIDGETNAGAGSSVRINPWEAVAKAVLDLLPRPPVARVATIAPGELEIYRVEAGDAGDWLGVPLCELPGLRGWTVLAIQVSRNVHLPHPEDAIEPREVLLIAGPPDAEKVLRQGLRAS